MTTNTEADSDTTPGTDLNGGVTADQPPADDAGIIPGADAGVGTGSLASISFLVLLLCPPLFYMLGSNLRGLIDDRGLLLKFTDSDPALDQQLSFKHVTMEMFGGYSVSHGILRGMSGGAQFLASLVIVIHPLLIMVYAVAFVRFIAVTCPNRVGFVDHPFTRGGHLL